MAQRLGAPGSGKAQRFAAPLGPRAMSVGLGGWEYTLYAQSPEADPGRFNPLLNPPPGPSPWCSRAILVQAFRLLGASWSTKSPFKQIINLLIFHWVFNYFGAPGTPNFRQDGPKNFGRSSQDGVRNMFLYVNIVLHRLGFDFGRS